MSGASRGGGRRTAGTSRGARRRSPACSVADRRRDARRVADAAQPGEPRPVLVPAIDEDRPPAGRPRCRGRGPASSGSSVALRLVVERACRAPARRHRATKQHGTGRGRPSGPIVTSTARRAAAEERALGRGEDGLSSCCLSCGDRDRGRERPQPVHSGRCPSGAGSCSEGSCIAGVVALGSASGVIVGPRTPIRVRRRPVASTGVSATPTPTAVVPASPTAPPPTATPPPSASPPPAPTTHRQAARDR